MVTRVPGLRFLADELAEPFVAAEHYARKMTKAPGHYSTALGRGHRYAHLTAEWLVSVFLAMVLGDPKNAATKVPACGDLRRGPISLVQRQLTRDMKGRNALDLWAPSQETIDKFPEPGESDIGLDGGTIFELLVNVVTSLAVDPKGETAEYIKNGFAITVVLGRSIRAEVDITVRKNDYAEWCIHCDFLGGQSQEELFSNMGKAIIERHAKIDLKHVYLLASLYANTLNYQAMVQASPEPATPPSALPDNQGTLGSSGENENAAPARAARSRNSPDPNSNPSPVGRTAEDTRERESAQAVSNCGSGRSFRSSRTPTYEPPKSCSARAAFA